MRSRYFFNGAVNERGLPDISWHGCHLNSPGWTDPDARSLAMTIAGFNGEEDLHVMMNMYWKILAFEFPLLENRRWYRAITTSASSPDDIADPGSEILMEGHSCEVGAQSIVILVSK